MKIPLPAINYMSIRAKTLCEDTGYVCPHWIDEGIANDLYQLDKADNGDRLKRYESSCHELQVKYCPGDGEIKFECHSFPFINRKKCGYSNPIAEKNLLNEMTFRNEMGI